MRKINKLIIPLFLLIAVQIFSYQYYKDINIKGNLKYKQFYITEDIYENSKNNLNDIRIINKNGENVPFVIENEEYQKKQNDKIISREKKFEKIVKKDNIEYIVKFNSQNPNEDLVANQILLTAKKNFYTEYKLFGSNNGTSWDEIIKGDEIYKTPKSEKLLINFDKKRYEYYKIVVRTDANDIFDEAILKYIKENYINYDEMIETNLDFEVEEKDKITVLKIKSKNLPLKEIEYDIEDEEFKRVYSISDKNNYYESGYISKYIESEYNKGGFLISTEKVPPTDLIIIEIHNKDNKPLKIKSLKGKYIPEKIVFKTTENEEYKITFGDENLQKLNYDLAQFSDMIKERDFVELGKLNKIENVKTEKPKDYSIYYNIFIGFIAVLLILFMAKKVGKK